MKKVLLVGEPLIRITPLAAGKIGNEAHSQLFYGGSEVNIACNLQAFGQASKLFTGLPANSVGDSFQTFLNSKGIDTSSIQRVGDRIGLYYMEDGFGCRQTQVYYDRKYTSITSIQAETIDFDQLFTEVEWVHFSGITLALGDSVRSWLHLILQEAKRRSLPISFDLNWRSKLISATDAKRIFSEFAAYADHCFGIEPLMLDDEDLTLFNRDEATLAQTEERMRGLQAKYGFQTIFHTLRTRDEMGQNVYKSYILGQEFVESVELKTPILQRVGSGDAFVAGALYQLLHSKPLKEIVDFAVASGTLKCTFPGDSMDESVESVAGLAQGAKDVIR